MLWDYNILEQVLVYSVWIIAGVIVALFLMLLGWRFYFILTQRRNEQQESEIEDLVFSYLNRDATLSHIIIKLQKDPSYILALKKLCRVLLKDLKGNLKEKVQQIIDTELVQHHLHKKLKSNNTSDIIDALNLYRSSKNLTKADVKEIKILTNHPNSNIAFAAALALIGSEQLETQFYALQQMCKRPDIAEMSVLELFVIFSESDKADFERRGELIIMLINSDDIVNKFQFVLVKAMGEINYLRQTPQLYAMLKTQLKKQEQDYLWIGVLLETLGKLFQYEVIPIIRTLIHTKSNTLKISCAKSLGAIQTVESIALLDKLFEDSGKEVRREAMLQMLKIGPSVLEQLPNGSKQKYSPIKKYTFVEIQEIKSVRYG